jgi:hypothetical protein
MWCPIELLRLRVYLQQQSGFLGTMVIGFSSVSGGDNAALNVSTWWFCEGLLSIEAGT